MNGTQTGRAGGFSLVELSISILVIGLLIGGVLAGNGLIRQAKFKKLHGEVTEAKEAAKIFADRYNALPGDMKNAFVILGGTTCAADADSCNGDGNGRIGYNDYADETYMAWKHLSLSDIYTGQFTGVSGTVAGKNFPATAYKTAGLRWRYAVLEAYDDLPVGNSLWLTSHSEDIDEGGISPKDAKTFDAKYDDGDPVKGDILGFIGTATADGTDCFNGTFSGGDVSYIATREQPGCIMVFRTSM